MDRVNRRRFLGFAGASGISLAAITGCVMPRSGADSPELNTSKPTVAPAIAAPSAPAVGPTAAPPPIADPRSSELALQALIEGNTRYVEQKLSHPNQSLNRLTEVAAGQKPFAAILGCADSRVPPEIVFDRGLGDLFVVRGAGNFADDVALGSLEFAVAVLGVSVIMVLGHERCGAVAAAVQGGTAIGHIAGLIHAIRPAVERTQGMEGDPVENAVNANVQIVVENLKNTGPILAEAVASGSLKIVGGRYDLDSGMVQIIA